MRKATGLSLPTDSVGVQQTNKQTWNETRDRADADFYTIGYSGHTLTSFLQALVAAGVMTLIDVRQNPVSMYKPDFSKRNLEAASHAAGLNYIHLPSLGVPRDVRGFAIEAGNRAPIWEWYDEHVAGQFRRNLHFFFNVADHPVAFMCVELDPTACHRHRLTVALEKHGLRGFDL